MKSAVARFNGGTTNPFRGFRRFKREYPRARQPGRHVLDLAGVVEAGDALELAEDKVVSDLRG